MISKAFIDKKERWNIASNVFLQGIAMDPSFLHKI